MTRQFRIPIMPELEMKFNPENAFEQRVMDEMKELVIEMKPYFVQVAIPKTMISKIVDKQCDKEERGYYISKQIMSAITQDRSDLKVLSDINDWEAFPLRTRDAVLARIFGMNGEWLQGWAPEWARELLTPKLKKVLINRDVNMKIDYYKSCPHQSEHGHGNFLFGADLNLASNERLKEQIIEIARKRSTKALNDSIRHMLSTFYRESYQQPTLIALGQEEYHELQHHMEGDTLHRVKVELVEKSTYLSIS